MRFAFELILAIATLTWFAEARAQSAAPQIPAEVLAAYQDIQLSSEQKAAIDKQIVDAIERASSAIKRETLREKYPSRRRIRQKVAAAFSQTRADIVGQMTPEQTMAYDAFTAQIVAVMSSHTGSEHAEILDSIVHDH